jgi:hypothetical protein
MYLTQITAEQVTDPSYELFCQVRVRWAYGDQMPDVIEFWWQGGSSANWEPIPPLVSVEEDSPAGVPGTVRACPRMVDDSGALEYRQPDERGEELIWNGFCIGAPFVGRRLQGKPADRCRTAPEITAMEVGFGSVTVRWTNPEGYDRFVLFFADANAGGTPHLYYTEDTSYRVDRVPGGGCWARVAGIHDGNDWTGTSDCRSPESGYRETSVPPELGYITPKFNPGTPLGTVKQKAGHRELFACLPDGRPVGVWGDPYWHPWYGHGAGPGFPPGAPLTALSRADGHMDLFGAAQDGRIYLAWWAGNPWREWFALSDPLFSPGAWTAALSCNTDQMDLFTVGADGVMRSTWWNGNPWRGWFALPGVAFPPGGSIAAHSRNPHWMEVAAVAHDGQAYINRWRGNWSGWQVLSGASFPPGSHVSLHDGLYCVANDGYVRMNTLGLYSPSWYKVE